MDTDSELSENVEDEVNSSGKRPLISNEKPEDKRAKRDEQKKNLYGPPTTEELNYLKETESLYNSNLFRLQIEELLAQINVKSKTEVQIKAWWAEFQAFVKTITPESDVEFTGLKKKIKWKKQNESFISFLTQNKPDYTTDDDITLKFDKPKSAELFGTYSLNTITKTDLHLDVLIKMPANCFREKDYLNNRYFVKRHFYTLYIFMKLCNCFPDQNARISYYGGHKLMAFIQLKPLFVDSLNIYVSGSEHVFKLHRFRPDKNNVKVDLFNEFPDVKAAEFKELGSPLYNSLMVRDLTLSINHERMQGVLKLKNVQDGIKLVSVWLKQREFEDGFGTFELEIVFYCMAYLVVKKKINQYMSSYQVVRIFWAFLCESDWHEVPLSLTDEIKDETLVLYKENYELTLLDHTGFYNVTSFLNYDVYLKVKGEARRALNILDEGKFDSFHELFITRVPFSLQCDALLKLKEEKKFNSIYEAIDITKKWKFYGFYKQLIISAITDLLKQGLTQRATHILPCIPELNKLQWNTKGHFKGILTFGLVLNPIHAFNVIEKSPPEGDPKSEDFRNFWKGLSDLRRFEDGTVCEAVYFKTGSIAERREIFQKILEFIFKKFPPVSMYVVSTQVEPRKSFEDVCLKIKSIYDDLSKKLRELKLPLAITSTQGTSESFSYTECKPPIPSKYTNVKETILYNERYSIFGPLPKHQVKTEFPNCISPLELVIQLGMSSKWPKCLQTLQYMKTQFYFEISKLLSEEHGVLSMVEFDHLDVLYEGLIFRLRIFVPREIQLAKKHTNKEGVISYKDNDVSLTLEKDLEILPKVSSALHGIQMRYPSFGPATIIIKRWIRSQLLDNWHISDVVLNLLNASLYLNTGAFNPPNLPQVAFIRFLKFLAEVDWKLNPVVVNFNNDIDGASLNEMEVDFQQNRHGYPPLYVIIPYDSGRSVFTKRAPSREVLKRLSLLGAEAYKLVQGHLMDWDIFEFKKLYVPNFQGYDLVIHLMEKIVCDQETNNTRSEVIFPIVDFDHVQIYLQHLRKMYGKFALFFHDKYKINGNKIGVLWKKKTFEVATDFKVLDCSGMKYVDGKFELNKEALTHDFFTCGAGLVATITKGS